jgi:hypothetical protein
MQRSLPVAALAMLRAAFGRGSGGMVRPSA